MITTNILTIADCILLLNEQEYDWFIEREAILIENNPQWSEILCTGEALRLTRLHFNIIFKKRRDGGK